MTLSKWQLHKIGQEGLGPGSGKTAHGIVGSSLLNLDSVYADRVQEKASCIAADLTLPVN